jgi:hypothetical protein
LIGVTARCSSVLLLALLIVAACDSAPSPTNVPGSPAASAAGTTTTPSAAGTTTTPSAAGTTPTPAIAGTTPAPSATAPVPTPSPASGQGPDLSGTPLVWFAPLPPLGDRTDLPFADGSLDYFDLFAPGASWDKAASSVGVFKIYSSWVDNYATDEQLRNLVEGTQRRRQALALEIGGLTTSSGCGSGVEGFDASLQTLDRIRAAGGTVSLVAFDEAYAFGHAYSGPNACRWSVERVAAEAATYTRQLRAAWPGIRVGDIEPLWSEITPGQLGDWMDAFEAAAGAPLDFLHLDADWNLPGWAARAAAAARGARSRGIPAGMIYDGGDAGTDVAWIRAAREHADAFEAALGGPPDQVVFQSWMDHPDHVLPDSDPATFTGLIRQYAGGRSSIAVKAKATGNGRLAVSGSIVPKGPGGTVAGAAVRLTAIPIDGAYQVSQLEGRVPAGATTAVVVLRVNTEDAGPGPVHLRIYRLGYTQGSGSRNRVPDPGFAAAPDGWGVSGAGQARFVASDRGGGRMLRVDATPSQELLVDSSAFPVTAGARYRFTAALRVPASATGNAYLAVVFLHGTEVARHRLELAPAPIALGTVHATPAGRFTFRGLRLDPGRYRLRIEDAGDADHWPASVEQTLRVR